MSTPQTLAAVCPASPRPGPALLRAWSLELGVALAYGLTGWAARRLALPPFDDSPLQLTAGLALACTLRWGAWRILPAVIATECLLQWAARPVAALDAVALATGLVGAATIAMQALLGAALVRRFVHAPLALTEPRDIAGFMLIGGFAACALTPAAVVVRVAVAGMPLADGSLHALTSWVAQAFGVCVGGPMALSLMGPPRAEWTRRRLTLVLPMCIGMVLLVATILGALRSDRERERSSFEREAGSAASLMVFELLEPLRALEAMRSIFTAAERVTRDGMHAAARPWLEGPGHLESVGFSTYVAFSDIPAFEARVRGDGVPNFKVFDHHAADMARHAPTGDVFGMTYLEPATRGGPRLGLNSLSVQAAREAILRTVATGTPAATRRFKLMETVGTPEESGVVTFQAVYRGQPNSDAERLAAVQGVALTTVRLEDTLAAVKTHLPPQIAICIVDVSAGDPRTRLAGAPGCESRALALSRVVPLGYAGRTWELRVNATAAGLPGVANGNVWPVAAAGLLSLSLLGALLLTVTGRARRIEVAIEEARHARQAADSANAAKGDFLANMSHEIRTPMNAILGMSHLALKSGLDPQQRNYVAKIEHAAKGLLGVIDDILDFAKIEAGKLDVEIAPFDLGEVLASLADVVGLKAEAQGLALVFVRSRDLPVALLGDALRLTQVLVNLAGNAVKFTERGSVVIAIEEVARQGPSCTLRFAVRDSGIGISAAQRQRLFKAFEQADTSTSRRFGGTGLGLAISHQLVQLMGGSLDLASVPGQGSEFFFTLRLGLQPGPADSAPAAAAPGRCAPVDPRDTLRGARILLVEDNDINAELALALLADAGMAVTLARDGQGALEALSAQRFDAVLMDCQMPVMDGYEATRAIRARPQWAGLPVIAMTANAMVGDRRKALAAGMNDHIAKPIDVGDMFATLSRWLPSAGPATAEPAEPDAGLTRLAGVDPQVGLAATLGNEPLYRRLLAKFGASQGDFPARFRAAVQAGDRSLAARSVHDLRATAGTLGVVGVEGLARTLETVWAGGGDPAALEAPLAALTVELQRVTAALRKLAPGVAAGRARCAYSQTSNPPGAALSHE